LARKVNTLAFQSKTLRAQLLDPGHKQEKYVSDPVPTIVADAVIRIVKVDGMIQLAFGKTRPGATSRDDMIDVGRLIIRPDGLLELARFLASDDGHHYASP
jgi:hypothetical protein